MQAAGGHIGGDQYGNVAIVKIAHQFQALGLRHVARQRLRDEPVRGERSLQHLGDPLGIDEHHGAARIDAPQQPHQQRDFFLGRREVQHLRHPIDRHLVRFDADQLRIVHVLVRQLPSPDATTWPRTSS